MYLKTRMVVIPDCSGGTIMYRCGLLITLAAVPLLVATAAHAGTSSGTITFTGRVCAPASAAIYADSRKQIAYVRDERVQPLRDARAALSSDVLDYFATYAPSNAKLVSVAYQ